MDQFLDRLSTLKTGYSEVFFQGARYGVTLTASDDGKRLKLYGEALGGKDIISFNLYRLALGEIRLKPCEMPSRKVIDFVLGFTTEPTAG